MIHKVLKIDIFIGKNENVDIDELKTVIDSMLQKQIVKKNISYEISEENLSTNTNRFTIPQYVQVPSIETTFPQPPFKIGDTPDSINKGPYSADIKSSPKKNDDE